jgi:ubiquinone/menaquinone biosynthesis C-methylase UbiE
LTKLNEKEVADKYNDISVIWDATDKWHAVLKKMIDRFLQSSLRYFHNLQAIKILNAGSAGNNYGLDETNMTHLDIADKKIAHLPNSIVGSIENVPLASEQFDLIMCLGTVINYCDPLLVFEELARLIKANGLVIIDFENSRTFELFGKSSFSKKATFVQTFYNLNPEKMWYFSEDYIRRLAEINKFKVIEVKRCHFISPLVYRITKNESFSAWFSWMDIIVQRLPILNRICANVIFLLRKDSKLI